MNTLKDKVIVITGASSGIGRGIALACAHEGADIVVNYRQSADKAAAVVNDIEALDGDGRGVLTTKRRSLRHGWFSLGGVEGLERWERRKETVPPPVAQQVGGSPAFVGSA